MDHRYVGLTFLIIYTQNDTLGAALYRDPLRNFSDGPSSSSSSKHTSQPQASSTTQENGAKPLPASSTTKRGEKLHINLKLLEKDGVEMSIQESRAASLGLLNKRWAPPPPEEMHPRQRTAFSDSRVALGHDDSHRASLSNEEDLHTRHLRMNMRLSMAGAGEPTVTINTKEALRDVFGMYNSPDKTSLLSSSVGSKHSLVRKVEPVTPATMSSRRPMETPRDENRPIHDAKTPGKWPSSL